MNEYYRQRRIILGDFLHVMPKGLNGKKLDLNVSDMMEEVY